MWDIRLYNWLGLFNKTMSLKIKKKMADRSGVKDP